MGTSSYSTPASSRHSSARATNGDIAHPYTFTAAGAILSIG
jgi:hypothetical protein